MKRQDISFETLENLLGRPDREESSTNRRELLAAKAVLRTALEQELTQRQKECVRLYFFEGLTEEETAIALGIGKSTVCRHLQKAKERLKKSLSYAGTAAKVLARTEDR